MSELPIEIILIVLDELLEARECSTIQSCMLVNKAWHKIIMKYRAHYLLNSNVFSYMLKSSSTYRNNVSQSVILLLSHTRFHRILTDSLQKRVGPRELARHIFVYVPNRFMNENYISSGSAPMAGRIIRQWAAKYFSSLDELNKAAGAIATSPNFNRIYKKYYSDFAPHEVEGLFGKIMLIYIAININDEELANIFPYQ